MGRQDASEAMASAPPPPYSASEDSDERTPLVATSQPRPQRVPSSASAARPGGYTDFFELIRGGDLRGMMALLDRANPKLSLDFEHHHTKLYVVKDKEGRRTQLTLEVSDTPLTYAVHYDRPAIAQELLRRGANQNVLVWAHMPRPGVPGFRVKTRALSIAIRLSRHQITSLILETRPDVNWKCKDVKNEACMCNSKIHDTTLLHLMMGTKYTTANLKKLLDLGADPEATSYYSRCDPCCLFMVCIIAPLTLGCSQLCCGNKVVLKERSALQVAQRKGGTTRTLIENAVKARTTTAATQ